MKFILNLTKILPFLTVIFTIMGGSNLTIGSYPLLPSLFLIPIFYWLVFRPDWLPLWALFIIGLFYDSLLGECLGYTSLLLIASYSLIQYIRPLLSPHHFFSIWGTFGLYSLGYIVLYGFFVSASLPLLISWIYGLILYPMGAWILSLLHLRLQSHA